jgi:hypothetical protein
MKGLKKSICVYNHIEILWDDKRKIGPLAILKKKKSFVRL